MFCTDSNLKIQRHKFEIGNYMEKKELEELVQYVMDYTADIVRRDDKNDARVLAIAKDLRTKILNKMLDMEDYHE